MHDPIVPAMTENVPKDITMTFETQVPELIENIIAARDGLRSVENYAGGEFCPVRKARAVMADAANALTALSRAPGSSNAGDA